MQNKGYKVAVVGATGAVGNMMIRVLERRSFPVREIVLLASERSAGKTLMFKGEEHPVQELTESSFAGVDIGLFSAGGSISAKFAPIAAEAGCVVIDNTAHFRMDPDVPLVVPEVNAEAIGGYRAKNIIANPNCSTIQMLVALKPLHDIATIKRIVVATYQSVAGAGREAMDELFTQTRAIFVNDPLVKEIFHKQIAFNCIPQIDVFMDDGSTKEEWKMVVETKKILDPKIKVTATAVRVPVFISHSEAVNVEFEKPISADEARAALKKAPGVTVIDRKHEDGFVTPVETAGEDNVYVSRIREDITVEHGLNMWVVADNLRKGAALNAIQIAELLAKDYL